MVIIIRNNVNTKSYHLSIIRFYKKSIKSILLQEKFTLWGRISVTLSKSIRIFKIMSSKKEFYFGECCTKKTYDFCNTFFDSFKKNLV